MTSFLSNFVDSLTDEIHQIKRKYGHDNKKCETCGIKYKEYECCLRNTNVKDNLMLYKNLY